MTMKLLLLVAVVEVACLVSGILSFGSETLSELSFLENDVVSTARPSSSSQPLMVDLTLIQGADSKGAGLSLSLSHTLFIFELLLCVVCLFLKTTF